MKTPELVKTDSLLKPYSAILEKRQKKSTLAELEFTDGKKPLKDCMNNHLYYGLHHIGKSWVFREKAPNARRAFLYGDFSSWQIDPQYELQPLENGDWELTIPEDHLKHGMLYKLWFLWDGGGDDRLPAYVRRVVQDPVTNVFTAQIWEPDDPYSWKYSAPPRPDHLYIYEAHIGMSSKEEKISSYLQFKIDILPRIKKLGYNAIQLMAIQEHPYYGSFGYQVSNFFAPSSRFGTPEELKELIDAAHAMEIVVILDLVHSHSVSNIKEGLSHFDGSDRLYFHSGSRGHHPVWDSRLFNYGNPDTITFLLSNIKYWLTEFRFDGLRFDGVTSMCYLNHGIGVDFVDYKQYFDNNVDENAITYLTLANKLIKEVNPRAVTIAEDVSGLPGLAFPVARGGIGFDYRMAMGIADYWGKIIKKLPDEKWSVGDIFFHLTDKRAEEATISYAESHDQAMVGDKTLIFRLIDREMYFSMSLSTPNLIVDRGMALHKIIRFLTLSLAAGGYLNFMGNEFGHPEWIDFPREGNRWSYAHALRRWDLADDPQLKYHFLQDFDEALIHFISNREILNAPPRIFFQNEQDQVVVFERNSAFFIINLNPKNSYIDYKIPCIPRKYHIALNTDALSFGGFGNIDESMAYHTFFDKGDPFLKLYLPARTAFVLTTGEGD